MSAPPPPIDAGLRERFRRAGPAIAWRSAPGVRPPARIAHLHDEEAFVRLVERGGAATVTVDSGPLGALVVLLESETRGAPAGTWAIDRAPAPFRQGALSAGWGPVARAPKGGRPVPFDDLVGLARYALA